MKTRCTSLSVFLLILFALNSTSSGGSSSNHQFNMTNSVPDKLLNNTEITNTSLSKNNCIVIEAFPVTGDPYSLANNCPLDTLTLNSCLTIQTVYAFLRDTTGSYIGNAAEIHWKISGDDIISIENTDSCSLRITRKKIGKCMLTIQTSSSQSSDSLMIIVIDDISPVLLTQIKTTTITGLYTQQSFDLSGRLVATKQHIGTTSRTSVFVTQYGSDRGYIAKSIFQRNK